MTKSNKLMLSLLLLAGGLFSVSEVMGQQLTVRVAKKISNLGGGMKATLNAEDHFGARLCNIGDLNRDGIEDMAACAQVDDGGTDKGGLYILFMNRSGSVKKKVKISQGYGGMTATFPSTSYKFGFSMTCMGDIDGDTVQDLAVGAVGANGYAGALWILFMKTDGTVKSYKTLSGGTGGLSFTPYSGDIFGSDVACIGDLNNDSVNDVLVGSYGVSSNTGAAYVLFLKKDGSVKGSQKITNSIGGFTGKINGGDLFGAGVAGLGDIDGDGIPDVAVGAPGDDVGFTDAGAVYILKLKTDGTVKSYIRLDNNQAKMKNKIPASGRFGQSIASIQDLNGDGINEIAVSAHVDNDFKTQAGAFYLLYLNSKNNVTNFLKVSANTLPFDKKLDAYDYFGAAICNMGTLTGKDQIDIAVCAAYDDDGATNAGAIYIVGLSDWNMLGPVQGQNTFTAVQDAKIYPNPATSQVTINYTLTETSPVTFSILDITGKVLLNSKLGTIQAGESTIELNLTREGIKEGVYFIKITDSKNVNTLKLSVVN